MALGATLGSSSLVEMSRSSHLDRLTLLGGVMILPWANVILACPSVGEVNKVVFVGR